MLKGINFTYYGLVPIKLVYLVGSGEERTGVCVCTDYWQGQTAERSGEGEREGERGGGWGRGARERERERKRVGRNKRCTGSV